MPAPPPLPPQNKRRRGGPVEIVEDSPLEDNRIVDKAEAPADRIDSEAVPPAGEALHADSAIPGMTGPVVVEDAELVSDAPGGSPPSVETKSSELSLPQLSEDEALAEISVYPSEDEKVHIDKHPHSEQLKYCPECYLPLHPDPKPEKLYIFLHALRYTTSLGCFETEMPAWAEKGFKWDRD